MSSFESIKIDAHIFYLKGEKVIFSWLKRGGSAIVKTKVTFQLWLTWEWHLCRHNNKTSKHSILLLLVLQCYN